MIVDSAVEDGLMPLQDSLGKRKPTRAGELNRAGAIAVGAMPALEELKYAFEKASRERGKPTIMSWRKSSNDTTYLLTVTVNQRSREPMWTLHQGSDEHAVVMWTYTSTDFELVHSMVYSTAEQTQAAQIPEFLRPKEEEEEEEESSSENNNLGAFDQALAQELMSKYEILSPIGRGGMGSVYKAKRKEDKRIVALKVLHLHLTTDPQSQKRFEQEAASTSALSHRNLIKVYEFGVSNRGQPYMSMEYLEGMALSSVLTEKGPLELPTFINLFTQICDGLQHAHEKGVVHRDIKPSNIVILKGENGVDQAKVVDFGIAKSQLNDNSLTPTGNVLGSPAYISPEQCTGAPPDPRSDLYSLGCVMYEAISGCQAFNHDNPIKLLLMQLGEPAVPLSQICPEKSFPEELERIIMKAMEKDPDKRYQSAEELGYDLWIYAATGNNSSPTTETSFNHAAIDRGDTVQVSLTDAELNRQYTSEPALKPKSEIEADDPQIQSDDRRLDQKVESEPPMAHYSSIMDNRQSAAEQSDMTKSAGPSIVFGLDEEDAEEEISLNSSPAKDLEKAEATKLSQEIGRKVPTVEESPRLEPVEPAKGLDAAMAAPEPKDEDEEEEILEKVAAKKEVAFRFKRVRGLAELEMMWDGLNTALLMQNRNASLSIFLDFDSAGVVLKPDVVATRWNLDRVAMDLVVSTQRILLRLIQGGATVRSSEKWLKKWRNSDMPIMPGVHVCNEEEFAEALLNCSGNMLDY